MQAHEIIDRDESLADGSPPARASRRSRRRFSLRGFTSLLLTLAFLAMCFSGVMLFLTPRGRVANWTDWSLLGLGKHDWGAVHVNNGILFVIIAALHLTLNWSVFVRYIKNKAVSGLNMKKEFAFAAAVAALCVAGPIYNLPPFSSLMALNEDIKDYWEQRAEQPPVAHAEELTLTELAGQVNLAVEQVSSALTEEGFQASDANLTLGQVGEQKGVAPSEVFAVIRDRYPESTGWGRLIGRSGDGPDQPGGVRHGPGAGRGQGRGLGRGMGRGMARGRASCEEAGGNQGL